MSAPVVEYIVHGYFHGYSTSTDTNSTHGAWWVPLRKLVKQLGKRFVEEKLQAFEVDALSYRNAPAPAAVEAEVLPSYLCFPLRALLEPLKPHKLPQKMA